MSLLAVDKILFTRLWLKFVDRLMIVAKYLRSTCRGSSLNDEELFIMVTTRYKLDKGVAFDSFEEIPTKVGNDNKS